MFQAPVLATDGGFFFVQRFPALRPDLPTVEDWDHEGKVGFGSDRRLGQSNTLRPHGPLLITRFANSLLLIYFF
jgi:hypothetical protein